jgi:hypothetical protein
VSLVEQELLTLPDRLSSPAVFSGVHVIRSLVLYACFVDRCLSFCTFSFGHCMYFVLLGIATYNSSEISLLNANLERGTTVGMGLQNIKRATSIVHVLRFKIHVIRSLVLYACFVDRCLSFCTFSFGHCAVCSSSIYGF